MAEVTPPTADPNARAELGRTPIPGSNPAGAPPNDEPEFEQLREEATKDPVQGPPSWETVARLGEGILREKSKDFVVASYTAVALAQIDGVAGLNDGLRILDGLVRTWWEQGSPPVPKRLRARANAVNWFAEKAGQLLERAEFKPADAERLEAALEAANALAEAVAEKFGDGEVGLGPVLAALREGSKRLAAEAPAPPAAERPAARPAPAPSATAAAPAAPDEIKSRSDAEAAVRRVTQFLRQQGDAAPEAYGLPRIMAWGPVRQAPPAQDGVTMIPPPSRGPVESAASGPPDGLVVAAEQAFAAAPLWLDLQRYTAQGLEQLGASHRAAHDLVVLLTRSLLERVPSLAGLQFSDGSPLADELTRQWLAEQVLAGDGGAAVAAPAVASSVDPAALAELRRESQPLVKKGQLAEVRARLAELFGGDPTPRGRFQERLELATLCFEGGRDQVALGMLEGLDAEMAAHELDRWDPALASRVLQALYRVHLKVIGKKDLTPEQSARRAEVFGRLCRLDPALAAALE